MIHMIKGPALKTGGLVHESAHAVAALNPYTLD